MLAPLEQFKLIALLPVNFLTIDFSITNAIIMSFILLVSFISFLFFFWQQMWFCFLFGGATRQSRQKKKIQIKNATAAASKRPFIDATMAKKPENKPPVVSKFGSK